MVATKRPGSLGARLRLPGTFFQRSIAEFVVRTVLGDIVRIPVAIPPSRRPLGTILSAKLICGHTIQYQRRMPATSQRNTAPCPECGAKPRMAQDKAMHRYDLRQAIKRCARDGLEQDALIDALELSLLIAAQPPSSPTDEELNERYVIALRAAGIDRGLGASWN